MAVTEEVGRTTLLYSPGFLSHRARKAITLVVFDFN